MSLGISSSCPRSEAQSHLVRKESNHERIKRHEKISLSAERDSERRTLKLFSVLVFRMIHLFRGSVSDTPAGIHFEIQLTTPFPQLGADFKFPDSRLLLVSLDNNRTRRRIGHCIGKALIDFFKREHLYALRTQNHSRGAIRIASHLPDSAQISNNNFSEIPPHRPLPMPRVALLRPRLERQCRR